jgi:fructosamine-3-kinase
MTIHGVPEALVDALVQLIGADVRVEGAVGGGCIHRAHKLRSSQGLFFLKWSTAAAGGAMLAAEAYGLGLLAAADAAVRVPDVIGLGEGADDCPAFLVLGWVETSGGFDQAAAGRMMARLHQAGAGDAYGLEMDNYIGSTAQVNGWMDDWVDFFRERRLRPQMELAARNGRLPAGRRRALEGFMERLDDLLGEVARRPALLHGDLWGGNLIADQGRQPVLIDPAVYYGDREADLAMTALFGGFSGAFYDSYHEVYPLSGGWRERFRIYNLYHLLNHLNLFGEGYGSQVDAVLRGVVGK